MQRLPTARAHGKVSKRAVPPVNFALAHLSFDGKTMKPTYLDLTVHDVGRAKAFFERVLGWRFEKFDMPYEYFRLHGRLLRIAKSQLSIATLSQSLDEKYLTFGQSNLAALPNRSIQ